MTDYKLVPVEPTAEMVEAARQHHEGEAYLPVSLYKAMLAAAPAVQGEPVGFVNPKLMRHLGVSHDGVVMGSKADSDRTMPLYAAPQPTGYNFADAMRLCSEGLNEWKAKAHNKRWWKRIDGTPIPNDLLCCIAEAFTADQPAQPAEQQPAPDVAGLVEALEAISRNELDAQRAQHVASIALAAHRKGDQP